MAEERAGAVSRAGIGSGAMAQGRFERAEPRGDGVAEGRSGPGGERGGVGALAGEGQMRLAVREGGRTGGVVVVADVTQ